MNGQFSVKSFHNTLLKGTPGSSLYMGYTELEKTINHLLHRNIIPFFFLMVSKDDYFFVYRKQRPAHIFMTLSIVSLLELFGIIFHNYLKLNV